MLWRILSAVILLFWAVMMGLVIQDTYFPNHSRFASVPPRFVFDLFLENAASLNNNLHLYHDQEKLGHTSFSIRKNAEADKAAVYTLLATGSMKLPAAGEKVQDLNYRLTGDLQDAERWKNFDLEVRSQSVDLLATVGWKEGDKLPKVEVKKGGQLVMNTAFLQTLMAMKNTFGDDAGWLAQLPKLQDQASASSLTAREGMMDLAGKPRRCYIVVLQMMQMEEIRLLFTEAGELARVELPQNYRFIEPMMHGLERGMNTLE